MLPRHRLGFDPRPGHVQVWIGCTTLVVVPCLPQGTLNRGAVCVRMYLRSCADLKEPGWPSESVGVRKQEDTQHACNFCKQKLAKDETEGPMWRLKAAARKCYMIHSCLYSHSSCICYLHVMQKELKQNSCCFLLKSIKLYFWRVLSGTPCIYYSKEVKAAVSFECKHKHSVSVFQIKRFESEVKLGLFFLKLF